MNVKILQYLGMVLVVILAIYEVATLGVGVTLASNLFVSGVLVLLVILSLIVLIPSRYTVFASLFGLFITLFLSGTLVGSVIIIGSAGSDFSIVFSKVYMLLYLVGFIMQVIGGLIPS